MHAVSADSPVFDPRRIRAVERTGLLHRPSTPGLDRLTRLAARLLEAPVVLVSLVTGDRQVFVSQLGLPSPWDEAGQTPLSHSFCQHVVDGCAPLVVSDARNETKLRDNLAIEDLGVISYAGMPIQLNATTLGSFCAIDGRPRQWSPEHLAILEDLAAAVASEIALEQAARQERETSQEYRAILTATNDAYLAVDEDFVVLDWNPAAQQLFGFDREVAVGSRLEELIVAPGQLERYRSTFFPEPPQPRGGFASAVPLQREHPGPSRLASGWSVGPTEQCEPPVGDTSAHRSEAAGPQIGAAEPAAQLGSVEAGGHRVELSALDRHGRVFPVEVSAQVTRTGAQAICHVFIHDISARRADQDELGRQAELIDAAPAAIVVRDPDGTIRSWNRGAEDMYGWPVQAVIGRNIHRLLDTDFPKSLPEVEAQLLSTGSWQGELRHRRRDGRMITALSRHVLRPNAVGTGHEVIETNTDITERLDAQSRLADSERQFRVQFHQSTVGQTIIGLDGRYIRVNDAFARMLGYRPEEMIGLSSTDLTHPHDRQRSIRQLAGLYADEQNSYEHVKRLLHRDGHLVDAQVGVRLVRAADGSPQHLIGFVQDITGQLVVQRERDEALATLDRRHHQLLATNQRLEAANQLKLDLMGMLSHDIGAPLSTIIGYGELLAEPDDDPGPPDPDTAGAAAADPDGGRTGVLRDAVGKILRAARRIDELRLDVLEMCARDADRMMARREPVVLRRALLDAAEAAEADVPVRCPEHLSVLVSPGHLQQIVTNYLTNARKYGGGATEVSTTVEPGYVTVAVADAGPGVPADVRERLFERWSRAVGDGEGQTAGHGLGLHIVAGLAEANGATVGHHDNLPTGSVFTLRLELTA